MAFLATHSDEAELARQRREEVEEELGATQLLQGRSTAQGLLGLKREKRGGICGLVEKRGGIRRDCAGWVGAGSGGNH